MLFSSKTFLALAVAVVTSFVDCFPSPPSAITEGDNTNSGFIHVGRALQANDPTPAPTKKKKKRRKKKHLTSFRVVSKESDLHFILAKRYESSVTSNGPPLEVSSIPGSEFVQNGSVHAKDDVVVVNNKIEGSLPDITEGSFYNQQCKAMEGVISDTEIQVQQNLCHYNFCLAGDGCLFMRSGGPFSLNPFDQSVEAVPDVEAIILGGTGNLHNATGTVTIKTISVPADNDGGESVLQVNLFLKGPRFAFNMLQV